MADLGKFVCFAPNKSVHKWIPVRNNTDKVVQERLNAVKFDGLDVGSAGASPPLNTEPAEVTSPTLSSGARRQSFDMRSVSDEDRLNKNKDHSVGIASWTLPGGGIAVNRLTGEMTHAPGLTLIRPIIFATKDTIIAFNGYLANTAELLNNFSTHRTVYQTRLGGLIRREVQAEPAWKVTGDKDTLEAEIVVRMYEHLGPEKMLPMLRGRFAFVLYDSAKARIFAARDPSGACALFECEDDEGGLFVSSDTNISVPGCFDWDEIPPGHYLCGRRRGLQQYAEPDDPNYLRRLQEAQAAKEFAYEAQNELSAGERLHKLMGGHRYHDAPGNGITRGDHGSASPTRDPKLPRSPGPRVAPAVK